MFRHSTTTAPATAATRIVSPGDNEPITSRRNTSSNREIIGNGKARLSTTWLYTSARVGLTPIATTTKAGAIVNTRRNQSGV